MTLYLRLGVVLLTSLPNLLHAYSCAQPKTERTGSNGNIHNFKAVVKCTLTESVDVATLKEAYRDEIMTSSQFTVTQPPRIIEFDGLKGYALEAIQKYDSGHGAVSVQSEIFILDNAQDRFFLELRSKKIEAKGDAKYTKFSHDYVLINVSEDKTTLDNIKELKVEKPWIAPDGIFVQKVQENVAKEMRYAAPRHSQKAFGVAIEALYKQKVTELAKKLNHRIRFSKF